MMARALWPVFTGKGRNLRPTRLHSKFEASLDYIARPCLRKQNTTQPAIQIQKFLSDIQPFSSTQKQNKTKNPKNKKVSPC